MTTMMNMTTGSNLLYVSCQLPWMTETLTLSNDDNDKNDDINIDKDDEYEKNCDTEMTKMMIMTTTGSNQLYVSCSMLASIDISDDDIDRMLTQR